MTKKYEKKKPSADYFVLYHLYRTGIIPKSDLALCRGRTKDRYIQRIIDSHIKAELIGTLQYKKCGYCFITRQGIEYLQEVEKNISQQNPLIEEYQRYLQEEKNNAAGAEKISCDLNGNCSKGLSSDEEGLKNIQGTGNKHWEPQERMRIPRLNSQRKAKIQRMTEGITSGTLRAEIRKGSAENFMIASGVLVYEEDRPDFQLFLKILSRPDYQGTFLWKMITEHGLYYPRRSMGNDGNSYDNRMQGVLFTQTGWYVVYNTLDRFSKWFSKIEEDNIHALTEEIKGAIPYHASPAKTLVLAVGRGMVAAMVSGHKYGRNRSEDVPDFIRGRRQYLWMTVDKMKTIFTEAYLAELNSNGLYSVHWLIEKEYDTREEEYRMLSIANPDYFTMVKTKSGKKILVEAGDMREVVIYHIYELTDLQRKKENARLPVTVIGPLWMAEAIAKSLGEKLGRYINIQNGEEVAVTRYTNDGEKVTAVLQTP